ncbi:hypothetical protein MNBD_UNCLBAC01-1100 [hydrothermal vent metagenome]|uniref:lipopolysaccharide heptosyltransferase II n=1 Tax=hydrothermal vent metagenome TaxID=652676 RepID=A0A3B1DFV9_9ZZZZ
MPNIKRILYVSETSRMGGGEQVLLDIIDNLDRTRFSPIVIAPCNGKLIDELRARGVKFGFINTRAKYSKFFPFPFFSQIVKFIFWILKENITLIHANGLGVYRVCGVAAFLTNKKRICHIHSIFSRTDLNYSMLVSPHLLIGCCEDISKRIKNFLKSNQHVTPVSTLVNGINIDIFSPLRQQNLKVHKSKLNFNNNDFIITTIGNLSELKGQKDFISMAKQVLDKIPNVTFCIIGEEKISDKGYAEQLKEHACALKISNRIKFLGVKSNIKDYLSVSDVFVLPSLTEGLPLVILEAMSCAKPVVATNINGIPEAVIDNETGFLVKPKDVAALSQSVLVLLSDTAKCKRMGSAGRKRLEDFFNLRRYIEQLQNEYAKIFSDNTNKAILRHRSINTWSAYLVQKLFYRKQYRCDKKKIKKILIISLDYIGDNVLSSAIFPVLKKEFPQASISIMVGEWTKGLYEARPDIKEIITYNCNWLNRTGHNWSFRQKWSVIRKARREKFDLIIDIRGSFGTFLLLFSKSNQYWIDRRVLLAQDLIKIFKRKFLKQNVIFEDSRRPYQAINIFKDLGIEYKEKPEVSLYIGKQDRVNLKNLLTEQGIDLNKKIISIHPGVNSRFKLWDNDKWAKVADTLIEQFKVQVVISGSKGDVTLANNIISLMKQEGFNLAGKMSLMQMAALIELSQLCICLDSGPMHIAGALNVPVIGLFGANHPDTCAPWTDKSRLLYHHLPCSDMCTESEEMGCDVECMKEISSKEVLTAATYFFKK